VSEDRWRAAHSMRSLAKFGRWDILDQVAGKWSSTSAGSFQAVELPFYYLHARLWLLIALDRLARDYPAQIARYKEILLPIALEVDNPHILMKHFAGRALRTCVEAGNLKLPAPIVKKLAKADKSARPRLRKKIRVGGDFYQGRPKTVPEPPFEFHFDYDFHKGDIDNLAHVFGQACWTVADKMSEIVHQLDPKVTGMWGEEGGRSARQSRGGGTEPGYQTHGQQLGWHALFFAAGQLLRDLPVTDDWCHENDPWGEWLCRYTLTRDDGLWLSDGTDRTPLDTQTILLEEAKDALALTGKREKLKSLVGLSNGVDKEIVIEGKWYSSDPIQVRISSALVNSRDVDRLAKKLTEEDAMRVWLPSYRHAEDDDSEYLEAEMKEYAPWIVSPSREARLDEYDPFGVSVANERSYIHPQAASFLSLKKGDPFGRTWTGRLKTIALRAQAWGREYKDSERSHAGLRLLSSTDLLREALSKGGAKAFCS
jgi:hypothetical protein